jgi:hypothetical protein
MSKCTCGSGAHPRDCAVHPERCAEHIRELNEEQDIPDEQKALYDLMLARFDESAKRIDELGRIVETQANQIRWLEGEPTRTASKIAALERDNGRLNARCGELAAEVAVMRGAIDLYARTAAAKGNLGRQSVMERVRADSAMLAARGDMGHVGAEGRLTPCLGAADGLEAIGGGGKGNGGACDG